MECQACNAVIIKGVYCEKCKTEGVSVPCAWCGNPVVVGAVRYVMEKRKNPDKPFIHTECRSAYLKNKVWDDQKRSAAGEATNKRLESAEYREKHKANTAKAFESADLRAKCSESAKKRFEDVTQRATISTTLKARYADPEYQQEVSERMQAFWDSDRGTEAKQKISESLLKFWTEEQRQAKSEFLQEFYQTERGLLARQAMSDGRIKMYSDKTGEQLKQRVSAKLTEYFSDETNRHKSRVAAIKFWNDPANYELRQQMTAKVKALWETEHGEAKKQELSQQRVALYAEKELYEAALELMQAYWENETIEELCALHREACVRHKDEEYLQGLVDLIKQKQGSCTLTDLSRATGLAYSTIVTSSKNLVGLTKNSSMLQNDVIQLVRSVYAGDVQENVYPDFLKQGRYRGKELDIYLPDKKLAIEVNGTYWHSEEQGKDKNYHYNKSKLCREAGIRLIHVWEHEWNNPQQRAVLESIIKSALGISKTIYARKLDVVYRKSSEMKEFFQTNNIQGFRGGEFAVCLVDPSTQEVLLAYLIGKGNHFSKGYKYEVIRGACKLGYNVVGGFSKAFKHLFADHPEIDNLVYYVDYNYFDGKSLQINSDWKFKSEQVSFKNFEVATGRVTNRNPGKHKEIVQGYADGSILKLWNAGVAAYVYNP